LSFPCAVKSRAPLGQTLAMQALEELFDALFFPRDASAVNRFFAGPLAGEADLSQLFSWKHTLDHKGMALFFREFFSSIEIGGAFARDLFQLVEILLSKEPKGLEAITRVFREIEGADPEEDALARRR